MSELLGGILTPGQVSRVVGRPVKTPLGLMYEGDPVDRQRRHLLFVLEPGKSQPCAIVKWAKGPAVQSLYNEQEALRRLQSNCDRTLAALSPRGLGPLPAGDGKVVTIQSYLPGRPLYAQFRTSPWPRRIVEAHFRAVGNWLVRFHLATRQPVQTLDQALIGEHIEKPLEEVRRHFGSNMVPDAHLDETLRLARLHLGCGVRLVDEHGDFWPSNLLLAPRQLQVIDWEHFRPTVLPGFDMLVFCTAYNMHFPWRPFGWADVRLSFAATFVRSTWLSKHVSYLLDKACASSGLPASLVPVMLPVAFCRMALRRAQDAPTEEPAPTIAWLQMLEEWWHRPARNWLDEWACNRESPRR